MTSDSQDDPSFTALSARLRHRIDSAYDSVASSANQSGSEAAGGFIVPESSSGPSQSAEYETGGFIIEDLPSSSHTSPSAQSCLHLSEIPRALGLLGLIPDDDIMGVFKNAAAGWGAQDSSEKGVGREDWRAVCAALLEGEGEDSDGAGEESPTADEDVEMGGDSGPDSDEYQREESSSEVEEPSDDEYEYRSPTTAKAGKSQKAARTTSKRLGGEIPTQLTAQQKAQCRQDFGRFFPDVPDDELDRRRIMIKDITRVADLLKEKLKAEEILEMLEAFSTSADKSMNLADFERMMIVTKMVK